MSFESYSELKLTKQDLNGAFAHVVVTIKLAGFFLQFIDYIPGVSVKQIDETLKNVQVESRCDKFTMGTPLLTCEYIL